MSVLDLLPVVVSVAALAAVVTEMLARDPKSLGAMMTDVVAFARGGEVAAPHTRADGVSAPANDPGRLAARA